MFLLLVVLSFTFKDKFTSVVLLVSSWKFEQSICKYDVVSEADSQCPIDHSSGHCFHAHHPFQPERFDILVYFTRALLNVK